jgi:hypothetical protein
MVKVVSYKNTLYLLRCVGLTPILYIHIKKNTAAIRTEKGLFLGVVADFENRELTEAEKDFIDRYALWFSTKNGEPHDALQMTKDEFETNFRNIFS